MAAVKKLSQRETYRAQCAEAMKDVRPLVAKHGAKAIANCLSKIKAHQKESRRLNALKREVAKLEQSLQGT